MKTYINGVFITEYTSPEGWKVLKLSFPLDKVDAMAKAIKDNAKDGWTKLAISKTLNPMLSKKTGKVISTHSLYVDTYVPEQQESGGYVQPAEAPAKFAAMKQAVETKVHNEDVPF